jgi:rhodanese-related sulfurtransferase
VGAGALPAPAKATPPPKAASAAVPARRAPDVAAETVEDPKRKFPPHGQPYREVSGEDVAWLHARPEALFLDARRSSVYQEGHIAGARSFPIWEDAVATPRIEALAREGRDGDAPVVVYCSGGNCEDSHMLCEKLFGLGFNNLLVYRDGWPDWQKRGGAGRTGPEP